MLITPSSFPRHFQTRTRDLLLRVPNMSSVFVSTDPTMAKAKPAPAAADKAHDVPTVSFRIIADDKTQAGPTGVHSVCGGLETLTRQEQSRSFGCASCLLAAKCPADCRQ